MLTWATLPALALTALSGLTLLGSETQRPDVAVDDSALIRVAAIQTANTMSDACVWSPEASAVGQAVPCPTTSVVVQALESSQAAGRALVWPDDFIELTAAAAIEAWEATVSALTDLYDYAFETGEPARKAGS